MGQVYGRMSLASASSRSPSGDHHTSCPSKTKPDCRVTKMDQGNSAAAMGRNRRRRSLSSSDNQDSGDDHDETGGGGGSNQLSVRMTRQAARLMAQQQAAQHAATIRRSVRLALVSRVPTSGGGSRLVNYRSINVRGCAGAASLPTTLRRSARIAGFRYIGHRVAADFGSSTSSSGASASAAAAALNRRRQFQSAMGAAGAASSGIAASGLVRRSERLLRV